MGYALRTEKDPEERAEKEPKKKAEKSLPPRLPLFGIVLPQ